MKEFIRLIISKLFRHGVYYVGSSDILPPPLSKEEEDEALELARMGDVIAKNKLIEHNLRLVVFLAKKYENTNVDLEDLVSIGTIGLRKSEISFEDSLSYDAEGNELHLEDVLGTDKDIVPKKLEDKIEKKLLVRELDKLSERDRKIMILRYGLFGYEEVTQKDVADMLGISQSYISRIEKKVIKKLKNVVKS